MDGWKKQKIQDCEHVLLKNHLFFIFCNVTISIFSTKDKKLVYAVVYLDYSWSFSMSTKNQSQSFICEEIRKFAKEEKMN